MSPLVVVFAVLCAGASAQFYQQPYAYDQYDNTPASYSFSYDVQEPLTGDFKSQEEHRDGDVVSGHYSLLEADGTKRTVEYTADAVNGFNAVVHKEGEGSVAHGYAATGAVAPIAHAPVAARIAAPAMRYAAPAYKSYAAPAMTYAKSYAAPMTYARNYAAPAMTYARNYAAPMTYARSYAAPAMSYARNYAAPMTYARSYAAPMTYAHGYAAPMTAAYSSPLYARSSLSTPYSSYHY